MDVTFEEESPVVVQVPSQSIINRPTVRPGAYVGGRIEETHDGVSLLHDSKVVYN